MKYSSKIAKETAKKLFLYFLGKKFKNAIINTSFFDIYIFFKKAREAQGGCSFGNSTKYCKGQK